MDTATVATAHRVLAPDGSEIRDLLSLPGASFVHCTLGAGSAAHAVRHRTVSECWFVLRGHGELWRKQDGNESVTPLERGTCITILAGTAFQFRNLVSEPLEVFIATLPPWPGASEAELVPNYWQLAGHRTTERH